MAGLAAIGGIVSGVASAAGAMMSAQGQADALDSQADAKAYEAQEQRRKGLQENAVKQRESSDRGKQMERVLSDQRAGLANSGGGVGTGSALVLATDTASQGILNRDASLWEGAEAQAGREAQARYNELEEKSLRRAADTTRASGVVNGISAIGGMAGSFKGMGGGGGGGGSYHYG